MEHTTAAAPPRAHEDERLRRMDALARDVLRSLCSILRDDALFGVLRSIEDEPDR